MVIWTFYVLISFGSRCAGNSHFLGRENLRLLVIPSATSHSGPHQLAWKYSFVLPIASCMRCIFYGQLKFGFLLKFRARETEGC